jgi:ClpX C4-type zinc finger
VPSSPGARALCRLHLHGSSLREIAADLGLTRSVIRSGDAVRTEIGLINAVCGQDERMRCNFCGKQRDQVPGLAAILARIAGKSSMAAICTECLDLCDEIITEEFTAETSGFPPPPVD